MPPARGPSPSLPWLHGSGVAAPAEALPSPGGLPRVGDLVLGGKYRMEALLGSGGMGVVMAAEHVALAQKVAFKFLAPRAVTSPDVTARFVREARAAARIDSEHVVRVSDVGVLESGVAYMLMERLEGEDLGSYLRRTGPLAFDEAVHYVLQACDAVAAAHAAGVIHRDLKPTNLFLARRPDGRCAVKVLDFGISKASHTGEDLEESLTRPGAVLGSPLYMSPEQVRDTKSVDTRTDIWSLGMVLYELLTGAPMYAIDTLPALCAAIVADPPVPLRAKRPDAPPGLEAAVLCCTQKEAARRFPTIAEFAAALAPFGPPEAALLAARVARRLGVGDATRPSGRVTALGESHRLSNPPPYVGGTDPNGPQPTAPVAVLTAARPASPRRTQVAAALGGAAFALILAFGLVFIALWRRDPNSELLPFSRSPAGTGAPPPASAAAPPASAATPPASAATPPAPVVPPLAPAVLPPASFIPPPASVMPPPASVMPPPASVALPPAPAAPSANAGAPAAPPAEPAPKATARPALSAPPARNPAPTGQPRRPPVPRPARSASEFDDGALLNRR